jgi:nucleolar protein 12
MSSLLGSIFGANDEGADAVDKKEKSPSKKTTTTSTLFEKSSSLPERPQFKPVPFVKRKKDEYEGGDKSNDINIEKEEEEEYEKLMKKKNRKRKSNTKEEGKDDEKSKKAKVNENEKKKADEAAATENKNEDTLPEKNEEERTIFVGNLPLETTTRRSLAAIFKDCGPIASTRIRSVPVKGVKLPQRHAGDQRLMKKVCVNTKQIDDSLKNTVLGYVVFKSIDSIPKALQKNNAIVDGMRIRVDRASPTVDPTRSVFVGGLPYGAEESSLQDHFVKGCALDLDDVDGVRIVRDKETFQCKGFGYVLFKEKTMIPQALKLHESMYMNKPLRVLVCGKRFKGKKGEVKPKYDTPQKEERVTVGAFRRMIAKQSKEVVKLNIRKRGEKKKSSATKAAAGGLSKRQAIEKKVEKKVKKLQKRITKGMGKARKA